MSNDRRKIISLALLGAATSAQSQVGQGTKPLTVNLGTGVRLDQWSNAIQPHLKSLDKDQLSALMQRNGAVDVDELSLKLAKRYPKLNPQTISKKPEFNKYFNPAAADAGTYEKGPKHDKEPYDKSVGYDRGGFSRT